MRMSFVNSVKIGSRIFVDVSDLKLLCSDKITRNGNQECQDFLCTLPLLDSISNAVRSSEDEEPYKDGEIMTIEVDTEKVDGIFEEYYKNKKKKEKEVVKYVKK